VASSLANIFMGTINKKLLKEEKKIAHFYRKFIGDILTIGTGTEK
jgi:hypothetical protein